MTQPATLRDGSEVPFSEMMQIYKNLLELQKNHPIALWDLAMKCRDASHVICPLPGNLNPLPILQTYSLLSETKEVTETTRKIVMNAIENIGTIDSSEMIDSLFSENVQKTISDTLEDLRNGREPMDDNSTENNLLSNNRTSNLILRSPLEDPPIEDIKDRPKLVSLQPNEPTKLNEWNWCTLI